MMRCFPKSTCLNKDGRPGRKCIQLLGCQLASSRVHDLDFHAWAYWTRWLRYALGMETEYNYGGHTIKVVAFQKIQEPCVWDCTIHIGGNRVPLGLFSTHYPAKHHPNGDEALGYGKKAAEFVVNHPAGSSGTLDELLREI